MPFKSGDNAKYNGMRGGRLGGKLSSANLSPEERKKRASEAAKARWERAKAGKGQPEKTD